MKFLKCAHLPPRPRSKRWRGLNLWDTGTSVVCEVLGSNFLTHGQKYFRRTALQVLTILQFFLALDMQLIFAENNLSCIWYDAHRNQDRICRGGWEGWTPLHQVSTLPLLVSTLTFLYFLKCILWRNFDRPPHFDGEISEKRESGSIKRRLWEVTGWQCVCPSR